MMMIIIVLLTKLIYILRIQYQYLIKKHEENGLENLKNPKALLIEYSNNMQDVFKNIEVFTSMEMEMENVMY